MKKWKRRSPPNGTPATPGYFFADHQRVDVVCAFVGLHGFQVAHVAHDRVFVHDSIGAQQIARKAGALKGHGHIVALEHGNMRRLHLARVFQFGPLVAPTVALW